MIKEKKNHFQLLILLVVLFALSAALPAQELLDSKGRDFWIAFPNNANATLLIFISSETATSGTVSIPGQGYSSDFTTTPGVITTVTLDKSYQLSKLDDIEYKAIHITAQEEVTVYGLSRKSASTDAFLCLPTDVLGDSYIIPSYTGYPSPSQLVVVCTQDSTLITITPSVDAQTRVAGVPYNVILKSGQAYQLQGTDDNDLTGSIITSSAPVAVFGSVECANITSGCRYCDFIAEEIPPVSTWGKNFISAPLAGKTGDIYRFLASEDSTTVSVNETVVSTLDKGEYVEKLYSTGLHIISDKPISVIQYSRGSSCAGNPGDPFMMLIPPYEQFLGNYTISTSDSGFSKNYINLVVPTSAKGDVRVDDSIVPADSFTAIGTSGYHYVAVPIAVGTHTINSNYPVGVHVYGFGTNDSYGYPGGQSFSAIAHIDSITLTPAVSTAQTGTSSCIRATVLDNYLKKVIGLRVDFYISGVSDTSGFAFTDSNGVAQYCYTRLAGGTDSIQAVTGTLRSNIVKKTWIKTAEKPFADAGQDQSLSGGLSCGAAVELDGSGSWTSEGTLVYRWEGPFAGSPLTGVTENITLGVGTHDVVLIVTNSASLSDTDTVVVNVVDDIAPVINPLADTTIYIGSEQTSVLVMLNPATASDNCSATSTITARRDDGALITDPFLQGTTVVWWKACDDNSNCDSAAQKVTVTNNRAPVLNVFNDTTFDEGELIRLRVTANDSDGTIPIISAANLPQGATFIDSSNGTGLLNWDIGCNAHGVYNLTFQASDGVDSVNKLVKITVRDINFAPKFLTINDTTIYENQQFTLEIFTEDCDGDDLVIRAKSIPSGASFQDNGNGTATFGWLPVCHENGYYMTIFEVSDGNYTVRDTSLIEVTDVNCYNPELTLSSTDTIVGINIELLIAVHATDRDGTITLLEASQLPFGAKFTTDGAGSGVLSWKPSTTGTFHTVITVIDAVDKSVRIDTTLTIVVNDHNFTGPVFQPCSDTVINENQSLEFTVRAIDPDGTIPVIASLVMPDGAKLTDNHNGSALVSWVPGCAAHGDHKISVVATDGYYSDTLSVQVVVRDQNCAPVIHPITDKNVTAGGTLRFTVITTDPDDDGTIPMLSVDCPLEGYSISVKGDGSAVFTWPAVSTPGSYTVSFFASDGVLTDTEMVIIRVAQNGTLNITTAPDNATIYAMPTDRASGQFIGTGKATWSNIPGVYWFRADAPGFRSELFTAEIAAEKANSINVTLKKVVPLMFAPPEEIKIGSGNNNPINGSIAFLDFDGDGVQDLSVAQGKQVMIYMGSDSIAAIAYRTPAITIALPADLDSVVAHSYSDWDNDGRYECIITLKNGAIHLAEFNNEELIFGGALLNRKNEKLFAKALDINRDNRKDLLVYSEQNGLMVYKNIGTDQLVVMDNPEMITDENGTAITGLSNCPILWDLDGDGWNDQFVARAAANIQQYMSSGDSVMFPLSVAEDCNAGGSRVSDVKDVALLLLPNRKPKMVLLKNGRLYAYAMRLEGDVTGDGVVDITDISNIAKAWELTNKKSGWNPLFNLKLSALGSDEVIDIRDLSKASRNWEMKE